MAICIRILLQTAAIVNVWVFCVGNWPIGQLHLRLPTLQQTLTPSQGQGVQKYQEMSTLSFDVDAGKAYYEITDVMEQT